MFETLLVQGNLLKKILESLKEIVTDANFECSSTGINLQSMDSAHVALVHLLLTSTGFDKYRCDKNLTMGINMNTLSKMLKCVSQDDSISMKVEDGQDKVTFLVESKDHETFSKFEVKLVEIEGDQFGIPDAQYPATIKMSSSKLKKICSDLSTMGDSCIIEVNKNQRQITFSVKGEDISGSTSIKHNTSVDNDSHETQTIIDCQRNIKQTFASKFLTIFCKASTLTDTVTVSLSENSPLMVEYKIPEVGHIRYYLAPKIDDEQENGQQVKEEEQTAENEEHDESPKKKVKKENVNDNANSNSTSTKVKKEGESKVKKEGESKVKKEKQKIEDDLDAE